MLDAPLVAPAGEPAGPSLTDVLQRRHVSALDMVHTGQLSEGHARALRTHSDGRTITLPAGNFSSLSFLATVLPARRAGALSPVDVLRYE